MSLWPSRRRRRTAEPRPQPQPVTLSEAVRAAVELLGRPVVIRHETVPAPPPVRGLLVLTSAGQRLVFPFTLVGNTGVIHGVLPYTPHDHPWRAEVVIDEHRQTYAW